MKRTLSLHIFLLIALSTLCQVHVTVGSPDSWSIQELAPYVGQTVEFDVPIVVCSNSSRLVVSPWRMYVPEGQGVSGSSAYTTASHINGSCGFTLTGVSEYHRCGEKIYHLQAYVQSTSELSFVSGEWRGNTRVDLEKGIPDVGDYRLLVCGFNVENYFVVNYGSLGARNESQHQAQREKISKALAKINADIFGLVELEQGNEAIQEIVNDLNANLPGRHYAFFHESSAAEAFQKADYVYDADKVEPIGQPSVINTEVQNRKRMVCFREKATGEKFIFSINHFKAMNTGDEYRRVNEARAVVNFYKTYHNNNSVRDNDLLVMGDLNCHAFTSPIAVFTDNGMIDLHRAFHADSSYSYRTRGGNQTSYIDHALANSTLYKQVTGMAVYHINSDENDDYNYKYSSDRTMFRCSDHDPVLVGLKLDSTLSGDPYFSGDNFGQDSLTFYYPYAPGEEELNPKMYFDIYTISGFPICAPTPIEFYGMKPEEHKKYYTFSSDNPKLPDEIKRFLPLPSGLYVIHIYYNGNVKNHKLIVR